MPWEVEAYLDGDPVEKCKNVSPYSLLDRPEGRSLLRYLGCPYRSWLTSELDLVLGSYDAGALICVHDGTFLGIIEIDFNKRIPRIINPFLENSAILENWAARKQGFTKVLDNGCIVKVELLSEDIFGIACTLLDRQNRTWFGLVKAK